MIITKSIQFLGFSKSPCAARQLESVDFQTQGRTNGLCNLFTGGIWTLRHNLLTGVSACQWMEPLLFYYLSYSDKFKSLVANGGWANKDRLCFL